MNTLEKWHELQEDKKDITKEPYLRQCKCCSTLFESHYCYATICNTCDNS